MKVTIIDHTDDPFYVCGVAAGVCYDKDVLNEKYERKQHRVNTCFKNEHDSVIEHAHITFLIEDVSRSMTHQLVRHRIASYAEMSQRYVKFDKLDETNVESWCVIPPEVMADANSLREFKAHAIQSLLGYKSMVADGVKPEDARYLLPGGFKTRLVITINTRSLLNLFKLRLDSHAQWEIRQVVGLMRSEVRKLDKWPDFIEMMNTRIED